MSGNVNLDHGPLGDERRQKSPSAGTGLDAPLFLDEKAKRDAAVADLGEGEVLDSRLLLQGRDGIVAGEAAVNASLGADTGGLPGRHDAARVENEMLVSDRDEPAVVKRAGMKGVTSGRYGSAGAGRGGGGTSRYQPKR